MAEHTGHGTHDDGAVHAHVHPMSLYLGVFGALVVLTLLTVGVYQVHLGALNLIVAVVIATVKAALVVTFFMHLKDDARFNALVFIGSLLFAGVFLAYTLNDTGHRGRVDGLNGARYDASRGEWAAGTSPQLIESTDALGETKGGNSGDAVSAERRDAARRMSAD